MFSGADEEVGLTLAPIPIQGMPGTSPARLT